MERRELTLSRICYVDETITDKIKVTYIALVAKEEDNFKTFDNIDKFIKNNLHKINDLDIRKKSKLILKITTCQDNRPKISRSKEINC